MENNDNISFYIMMKKIKISKKEKSTLQSGTDRLEIFLNRFFCTSLTFCVTRIRKELFPYGNACCTLLQNDGLIVK